MDKVVEAAIHAFEQGWAPIPIRKGEKRPAHSDWPNTRYKTANEIESAFKGNNLGVLLGDASNGLIDIDLDSREAQVLADGFLPVTRMVHGRESSPKSHYWYRVEGWSLKVQPFYDPVERMKQNQGAEDHDPDRLVLMEIRGTGGQTLLPPSTHPSGEKYKWYNEWHAPAVVPHQEIEKTTRWLAAAALLARYWPGEGKRHQASMALAGGLLKIEDKELNDDAEVFLASVALAAGDEEGFDRQQDVASTRDLIKRGKKVKGWPSLAKLIPKRVVQQVVEWLSPPVEETGPEYGDGSMSRQPLSEYVNGEIEPHPMLVEDLIYASKVTWLQGEPGNGKTLFALWLAMECIAQGYRVMMIDEESGPRMTGERFAGLGAEGGVIDESFFYYPFSSINVLDPEHRMNFNKALEEAQPHLIIFDSVSDILAQAALKESDNDDVNSLIKHFVEPLRGQDVASLFIDHMSKGQTDNGWARGAGSKKAKTDASWTFTATKAFDKETVGRVSLKRAKDRLGQLPLTHVFKMGGDGKGNIVLEKAEVVKNLATPKDKVTSQVIGYLKDNANTEDSAISIQELSKQLEETTGDTYRALQWIIDNMAETPIEAITHRGVNYWFYAGDMEIDWAAVGE